MAPTPKKTAKKSEVERLMKEGREILKDVDKAAIFQNTKPRQFPQFEIKELKIGKVLGVGGFCVVREINGIVKDDDNKAISEGEDAVKEQAPGKKVPSRTNITSMFASQEEQEEEERFHEDVQYAKKMMASNHVRDGQARYAIKRLKNSKDLGEKELIRGRIDLAIETKYLKSLYHPNIVKMRGYASGDMLAGFHFIILDRLYGTMEDKMEEWKAIAEQAGAFRLFRKQPEVLKEVLVEKLTCAYDLAAAFRYIHSQNIVYRDIKPENIGFDVRGDVKVFDFGLAKNLDEKLKSGDNIFKLTARTGSFPYMAPEVAVCEPYNTKCDVFSFSILLWEILSYKVAFEYIKTRREFYDKIALGGQRPPMIGPAVRKWPCTLTKHAIMEGWARKPAARPDFDRFASLIRSDLQDFSGSDLVHNRTIHMLNRSRRSLRYGEPMMKRASMAARLSSHAM